jgi:hypothetical protein
MGKVVVGAWSEEATTLLMEIEGQTAANRQLKRNTILVIADYILQGKPITAAFRRRDTGSQVIHYSKWMKQKSYKAAYDHLIGSRLKPGEVMRLREEMATDDTADAVAQIQEAYIALRLAAPKAVGKLTAALNAKRPIVIDNEIHYVRDYATSVQAANALLDRIPETAKNNRVEVEDGAQAAIPEAAITAIGKIYGGDDE